MPRHSSALTAVFLLYLGLLAWITLTPAPYNDGASSLLHQLLCILDNYPLTSGISFDGLQFTANIVLFIPLGLLFVLRFGRRSWLVASLAGVIISCWIELAQYVWLPTRVSDPFDVLSNAIGTVLGVGIAMLVMRPDAGQNRSISHDSPRIVDKG